MLPKRLNKGMSVGECLPIIIMESNIFIVNKNINVY